MPKSLVAEVKKIEEREIFPLFFIYFKNKNEILIVFVFGVGHRFFVLKNFWRGYPFFCFEKTFGVGNVVGKPILFF